MSNYKVTIEDFEDLTEEEQGHQSNNGWGRDNAQYLRVEYKGETLEIQSDAMEPEDVRFSRDLNWIKTSLEKAYELGKAEKSPDTLAHYLGRNLTLDNELKRTAELLVEIIETQGLYYAISLLYDSSYDLERIGKLLPFLEKYKKPSQQRVEAALKGDR